jgi:hypothetical protein
MGGLTGYIRTKELSGAWVPHCRAEETSLRSCNSDLID